MEKEEPTVPEKGKRKGFVWHSDCCSIHVLYLFVFSFVVASGGLDVTSRNSLLDSVRLCAGKKGFSAKVK